MKALQVGLFTADRNFIITNLDAQTIELEKYQYTKANITIFRIVDPELQEFKKINVLLEEERNSCSRDKTCTQEEEAGALHKMIYARHVRKVTLFCVSF